MTGDDGARGIRRRRSRFGAWLVHGLLALLPVACAQLEMPPGGPEDNFPPYVIETVPDTFSVVEPGLREISIRFSERISERASGGTLNDAVVVSPPVEGVRVRHRRDGILISLGEGLLPDRVYRITVLPIVNDMFNNNLRDAFDLVISTGPEFVPNVVAGMVEDRVTGRAVPDVRVEARFVQGSDTIPHWNISDSEGVFSLRFVPDGAYEIGGWQDRNRDREVGATELQAAFVPGELAASPDTSFSVLSLIEPDTTPPRLARVDIVDSLTLRFEFDDYLEPTVSGELFSGGLVIAPEPDTAVDEGDSLVVDTAGAAPPPPAVLVLDPETAARRADSLAAARAVDSLAAAQLADSLAEAESLDSLGAAQLLDSLLAERLAEPIPVIVMRDTMRVRFFQEHEYTRWRAAREDSLAAAREEPDPARGGGEPDPGEREPPDPEAPGDAAADSVDVPVGLSGLIIPSRTLVGVLDGELPPGVPYAARVEGTVNIYGTAEGGGVDTIMRPLPPPPEQPEDSTVVQGEQGEGEDSVAPGDSAAAGDTLTPPDTLTSPDTLTQSGGLIPPSPLMRPGAPMPAEDSRQLGRLVPRRARASPVSAQLLRSRRITGSAGGVGHPTRRWPRLSRRGPGP